MTDGRLARGSAEVLVEGIPDGRISRLSVEALVQPIADGRLSRDDIEVLVSNTPSTEADTARLSAEVLVGPEPPVSTRSLLPRRIGRGRLGCGVNEAYITWQCGTPRFCPVLNASDITWSRSLNDISEAQVIVPISGVADDECCDCLGDLEPWCHELHIARDGEDVWLGPITEVVYEVDKVTIRALDLLGWTTVRVPAVNIDYTAAHGTGPVDISIVGLAILEEAFAEDDECAVLTRYDAGVTGERLYAAWSDTAFNYLDDLSKTGVDYTAVGRTILLLSAATPSAPIATLMDDHILGAVQLTKSGLLQADRWYVHFQNDATAIPPGPGMAEVADKQCYGVVERIQDLNFEMTDVDSAREAASDLLKSSATAPRLLEVPDGSRLSPEAPWPISAMIPGVRCSVAITRLCVDATQDFILTGVSVRQGGSDEEVTLTLGPLDALTGSI